LIGAANFLKDHDQLSLQDKINRFEQRTTLNELVLNNSPHLTLNFGATEALTNEKMVVLADRFMEAICFGDQPYLIYRHYDAGHTHLHIVTVNIDARGEKINISPFTLAESHRVCRKLESEFFLQPSVRAGQDQQDEFSVDHAQKVILASPASKERSVMC